MGKYVNIRCSPSWQNHMLRLRKKIFLFWNNFSKEMLSSSCYGESMFSVEIISALPLSFSESFSFTLNLSLLSFDTLFYVQPDEFLNDLSNICSLLKSSWTWLLLLWLCCSSPTYQWRETTINVRRHPISVWHLWFGSLVYDSSVVLDVPWYCICLLFPCLWSSIRKPTLWSNFP